MSFGAGVSCFFEMREFVGKVMDNDQIPNANFQTIFNI